MSFILHILDILENQFRGRPLIGEVLTLLSHNLGLVIKNIQKLDPEDGMGSSFQNHVTWEKSLQIFMDFDLFHSWNWDRTPTGIDQSHKLANWLLTSNSVGGNKNMHTARTHNFADFREHPSI